MAERRLGAAVLAAALLCAAAGLAAWWRADARTTAGQPVASVAGAVLEREASPEVEAALQRAVRLVRASGCGVERQATATVVERGGRTVGLTNQHVVAGAAEVAVDGADRIVLVRGLVDGRDAVELDGEALLDGGAEPLAAGPRPIVGARVVVAGYPDGRFAARTGTVRAVESRQGYGGTADVLLIDVEAVPGISGGVVVDAAGRAVGLVAARDPVTHEVVAYPLDVIGRATDHATAPCA
ncbi:S1 family peptidase [Dermatobacter hominis]|uniref:S1 family peptidase n=1 Tax=Dermatobacter hominis TaxID=2884263 RepID=UPI001D111659|nr:serine protease [Dermatobacter hominis]UDY34270.1 trypsin-like peptidase domain-containing protein [Dermatobacter hominis]